MAVLACRAGELEKRYRSLCDMIDLEFADSSSQETSDSGVNTLLMAEAKDFETLQKVGDSISDDMLWLSVNEKGEKIEIYGEELPDNNIGLIILISDSNQNLLMYMEGNQSIAGNISIHD